MLRYTWIEYENNVVLPASVDISYFSRPVIDIK
jgi:hypothetical protein